MYLQIEGATRLPLRLMEGRDTIILRSQILRTGIKARGRVLKRGRIERCSLQEQEENWNGAENKRVRWSGRQDLNLRPPAPKAGALPDCATPRLPACFRSLSHRTGLRPG